MIATECVQHRTTKYIYTSSHKSRLQLPLMYNFELQDIIFFIKSSESPSDNFNIYNHITFARGSTSHQIWYLSKTNSIKITNDCPTPLLF